MKKISFCLLITLLVLSSSSAFGKQKKLKEVLREIEINTRVKNIIGNAKLVALLRLEVLGGFSGLTDRKGVGGGRVSLDFSPTIKFDENNYLIPLFFSSIERKVRVIPEEEGGELTVMDQDHNAYLAFKHIVDERTSLRIAGFGTWSLNKETRDEDWGEGLYDYRDFGGNINFQFKTGKADSSPGVLSSTTEYYLRRYPNFQSLISLTIDNAPEKNEKDYRGIRQMVDYQWQASPKFLYNLGYSFLHKRYIDKLVVNSSGVLSNKKRLDYLHNFNAGLLYSPVKQWQLKLDVSGFWNLSNQNYYDTRGTFVPTTDDIYTPRYFDYALAEVRPSLIYLYPLAEKDRDFVLEGAYEFLLRVYSDRKAQTRAGAYTTDTQTDYEHSIILKAVYPVNRQFSLVALGEYTISTSNMDYERFYLYNYHSYAVWSGFSFRY